MSRSRSLALALSSALCACTAATDPVDGGSQLHADGTTASTDAIASSADAGIADATSEPPDAARAPDATAPPAWDPSPTAAACLADTDAPLLDLALSRAGLDRARFGITDRDLESSVFAASGALADELRLSWIDAARAHAHRAGCLEAEIARELDAAAASAHPVASMIRAAAKRIDRDMPGAQPVDPNALAAGVDGRRAGAAFERICAASMGPAASAEAVLACAGGGDGALADDLAEAIAPLLIAIAEGLEARRAREERAPRTPEWWRTNGGYPLLLPRRTESTYDPADPADREYLIGADRARLYAAAAAIAYAVEAVDWPRFGGRDARFDLSTPAGAIRLRGAERDTYAEDGAPVLLLIDLGGDDVHLDDVAANRTAANAVSVAIDLAGDDTYGYVESATPYDRPELLPADADGRSRGNAEYGPVSLSRHFRQGSALNGIAMLFDLGVGRDSYRSLRGSQGYAHQGVGVLFDGGGDDHYAAEAGAQGVGQFGVGLAIDLGGGRDERRAFSVSQGLGYSGGAGILYDDGGDDTYVCDHGDPAQGGLPLYFSPQLPHVANTSLCQGAGFGIRGPDSMMPRAFLSGGVGVLRDRSGRDRYEGSVFAQGTAYWQGVGVLSDGGGEDSYDALYYAQGAGVHYAVGILGDAGPGADRYDATRPAANVCLGAGHDFSLGALIDDEGDSEYHIAQLSAGASNCNGIGLFVDNGGDDTYAASSLLTSGIGHLSAECADRAVPASVGVMIDAGGRDTYSYPAEMTPAPSEGGVWGRTGANLPSEHGAGLDATGESGVHP